MKNFFLMTLLFAFISCNDSGANKAPTADKTNSESSQQALGEKLNLNISETVISGGSSATGNPQISSQVKEIIDSLKNGEIKTMITSIILLDTNRIESLGYLMCLDAQRSESDCSIALGASHIGFGLCMSNSENKRLDCNQAIGNDNLGYGLCMLAGISKFDCKQALGIDNTGFGLCMMSGRSKYDCQQSLGMNNTGFGLCMAGDRSKFDCTQAIGADNIGYGLCMISGTSDYKCSEALGSNNISYGMCLAKGFSERKCNDLLE